MNVSRYLRYAALLLALSPLSLWGATVQVTLDGVEGVARENVQASLSLLRRGGGALRPDTIRELHQKAEQEIIWALEPFGYYQPTITSELSPPEAEGLPWQAHIQVDVGEPVALASIAITLNGKGEQDADLLDAVAKFPLQQGQPLDHRDYEAAKAELLTHAQTLGYRDAAYSEHRVEVDLPAYEARLFLVMNTGPGYVFGEITFDQDRFDEAYLARYLLLEPGDAFDARALGDQRRALSRSGHFREVEIETLPATDTDPPAIPLRVHLQTFLPNRYRGRLGWGTDTGVGLQGDWDRRYVGRKGQHFNLGLAVVQERSKLAGDINYVIPLQPLEGSQVTIGARHESKDLSFEDVDLPTGGETRIATNIVGVNWELAPRRWGTFQLDTVLGLAMVGETYDVFEVLFGDKPPDEQEVLIEILGEEAYGILTPDFEAVVPSLRLVMRRSNDPIYIRSGDYFDLSLLGADESLGSNISFWQARMDTWHVRSFGERSRVLVRSTLGYSDAESRDVLDVNFNEMPEYYEFRAGGVRSVRGYGWESLFPQDSITGGKSELVLSLEYEYEFMPDWSVAAFVDGGNAFNRWEDYEPKYGTGLGIRWRSPVGLARIDLGVPLDDADESFQIYITVGPEF